MAMNSVLKRVLTGLSIGALVVCACLFTPQKFITPIVCVFIVLASLEFLLLFAKKRPLPPPVGGLFGRLFGLALIALGLLALPKIAGEANGRCLLLYVLAVVKFSDVGGFAFGLLSARHLKGGNHKLCPSISPGKSWEGLLGSLLFSSAVSLAFMPWTHFGAAKSVLFGCVAALIGTAGDLIESKFKRWVQVKDSSAMRWTNGMGGFLDMVDSLLLAPGVLLVLFWLTGCQFCDRVLLDNPGESQVLRVMSGDRYYMTLEENMTTGYSWRFECDSDDVEVLIDHEGPAETRSSDGEVLCGAPGKANVRIRIFRGFDGPATVRFFYQRPWEKEPIKSFNIGLYKRTGDAAFWK